MKRRIILSFAFLYLTIWTINAQDKKTEIPVSDTSRLSTKEKLVGEWIIKESKVNGEKVNSDSKANFTTIIMSAVIL